MILTEEWETGGRVRLWPVACCPDCGAVEIKRVRSCGRLAWFRCRACKHRWKAAADWARTRVYSDLNLN